MSRNQILVDNGCTGEEYYALAILHLVRVVPHTNLLLRRIGSVQCQNEVTTVCEDTERLCAVQIVMIWRNLHDRNTMERECRAGVCRVCNRTYNTLIFEIEVVCVIDVRAFRGS